jgi:pyruvate-ferredoxin/flavodoxin oxidoreductase
MAQNQTLMSIDGNYAAAHVAYALSDVAFIFPITPSSPMGEHADAWAAQGRKNIFGECVDVTEMQSEAGAAGAVHGGAAVGALVTTYTASQGLLLMIPNMFKIAGELMPVVFHVTARSVAAQALCIFGDHTDVMATRTTGFALMSSHSVQEAHDFALISHLASLNSSLPFLHYFDGFRTSHEIQKISVATYDAIKEMVPMAAIQAHRDRGLNPKQPHLRGTSQGPDVYFQNCEATNKYYNVLPDIVDKIMAEFAARFGRKYGLFDYYGAPDAERIVVLMGAGAPTVEEAVTFLQGKGEKVGVLKVHLYRPWSVKHFISAVPKTVKFITVLERTKEPGAMGEPMYLDVCSSFQECRAEWPVTPIIIGGRYGLGSKDFTPAQAKAVFDNMTIAAPKNHFVVGIEDDVTFLHLPVGAEFDSVPQGTTQCMFWGLGSDGTVGANHDAIKIIGDNTPMWVQGYFAYDAHKSGGVTVSHLRFGKESIKSQYLIKYADYVACHFNNYVYKYDMVSALKQGGTFVLNTPWTRAELEQQLPGFVKRAIAQKKAKFYTVDAASLADSVGLGRRINMVMQAVFFKLSGVLPYEQAVELLKKAIAKTYGSKGTKIVEMNNRCVDMAIDRLASIDYPESWASASAERPKAPVQLQPAPKFVTDLLWPQLAMEGNALAVSKFTPGGIQPLGTTKYEKRGIAPTVPIWDADRCMQCNECALVCPHAAIRPFVLSPEEAKAAPFASLPAKDAAASGKFFRIQVSALDCTGCEVCPTACLYGALRMKPLGGEADAESANWEYCVKLANKGQLFDRTSLVGSQFQEPLLEFSGACEGCNETAHIKLITQLFGERMIIANATGCSSIWGGTWGTIPYTVNQQGHGPAWGNSLFEDNAEYGFGMACATAAARRRLQTIAKKALGEECTPADLKQVLAKWVDNFTNGPVCEEVYKAVVPLLERERAKCKTCEDLFQHRNYFPKISQWIFGGDGWAYDIGYGGLDHVIASGVDLNVIVMDTEMYSNTGGQKSKATPMGAVAKFAANGCRRNKKDLGMMAMSYQDVYVASTCLQANYEQYLKAITEAESYPGCSIVLCYCPCREQGFPLSQSLAEAKAAIDSGYWNLYRFDPRLSTKGQNPFQLDHPNISLELKQFLSRENRYESLMRTKKDIAEELQAGLKQNVTQRMDRLRKLASDSAAKLQAELAQAAPVKQDVNKRVPIAVRAPAERAKDMKEVVLGYTKDQAVAEAKRCLTCKKPFCKEGCPQALPIPEYIDAIAKGDFGKSFQLIMGRMPLIGICGRVCPHNCEARCIRGKKGEPLAIEALKRAASDYGALSLPAPPAATGKRVAVVGSGPAGLAAAYYLAQQGHKVVIFEQKAVAGGMLSLCIPPYRLPREVVKADIDRVVSLGVEIRLNSPINAQHSVADLLSKDGFNAVFIGVGTLKPKSLGIAGEDAAGVEHVIPFLESIWLTGRTQIGKRVAVIGAGFSAMDAVRTAKRLGSEAFIVYRRQREQMPASPEEVHEAEEEGCTLHLLTNPTKVIVKDGKVAGIECQKQRLGAPDRSGRPAPEPIPGSEYTIECDMVIQAISQEPELAPLKDTGFKVSKWNTIEVDPATFATAVPGVWAAGDAVTGPKTIVEAVADAWKAAENIHATLSK